jgi:S-phase kinase-associated protein 1
VAILISQDGEKFEVSRGVIDLSELLKTMANEEQGNVDDEEEDEPALPEIPVPNVKANVLAKVLEFGNMHVEDPLPAIPRPLRTPLLADSVPKRYADFVDGLDQDMIFELILAANYLDMTPLLELTCATVAAMIKGKTPEEIRRQFNIRNDFTPEEERAVCEEVKWSEE